MKNVIRKRVRSLFLVDEQTMRRVFEEAGSQMARVCPEGVEPHRRYEMRLRDGTVVEGENFEEVLADDNAGPRAPDMIRLELALPLPVQLDDAGLLGPPDLRRRSDMFPLNPGYSIAIEFDLGGDEDWRAPEFHYRVDGEHAWALVCASELDKRITRCRIRTPANLSSIDRILAVLMSTLTLFVLLVVVVMRFSTTPRADALHEVEQRYASGELRDVGQLVIDVAKAEAAHTPGIAPPTWVSPLALGLLALCLFLAAGFRPLARRWGVYGFSWGDNAQDLAVKIARWRTFWTGVVLALSVSVLGSLTVSLLTWKH